MIRVSIEHVTQESDETVSSKVDKKPRYKQLGCEVGQSISNLSSGLVIYLIRRRPD